MVWLARTLSPTATKLAPPPIHETHSAATPRQTYSCSASGISQPTAAYETSAPMNALAVAPKNM